MLTLTHFAQLLPLFLRERQLQQTMVLATIIRTAGSTYRKAGAQMLIAQNGEYAGLLSGGCLEGDLRDHADQVLRNGCSQIVQYDMRSPDDQLFGLGAGCEGAMDILLQPVGKDNQWQPLAHLYAAWQVNRTTRLVLIVRSQDNALSVGSMLLESGEYFPSSYRSPSADTTLVSLRSLLADQPANTLKEVNDGLHVFLLESSSPPRLLILGAGPDAQPLATLAHFLGWKTTIYDHRSAYATAVRFPYAEAIICARPELLLQRLRLDDYHAVIVMSHHLDADLQYLRQLVDCNVLYVGLLGPAARRERLFADLGNDIDKLQQRLHAPVGLTIGAVTPEAIALAIIGEIHSVLARIT